MCNIFGNSWLVLIRVHSRKHNRRSEGGGREDGSVAEGDDKVGLLTSALMEEELEENMSV